MLIVLIVSQSLRSYCQENCDVLEQLAVACPNLQHLKLQGCSGDTFSIEGLRLHAIACSTLQARQIELYKFSDCSVCMEECNANWSLLSHFPALKYCKFYPIHATVIQDIVNNCKKLTVLSCDHGFDIFLLLSSVNTSTLQQLNIREGESNIPNIFLETVSAHGGLVHVSFYVNSVSAKGITSLVENSPNLLTCIVVVQQFITDNQYTIESLKHKFILRKLFTVGRFSVTFRSTPHDIIQCNCIPGTDFLPLWNDLYY